MKKGKPKAKETKKEVMGATPATKATPTGVFSLLKLALDELVRNPMLFAPKFVSVTVYAVIYAWIIAETKATLATGTISPGYFFANIAALLFMPAWIAIDSMYPKLVEQLLAQKRLDFWEAIKHSLSKFFSVFAFMLSFMFISVLLAFPFIMLAADGMTTGNAASIAGGAAGALFVLFVLVVVSYFMPTSILLEKKGLVESVVEGFGATRKNLKLVLALSIFSFVVLIAGFALEGAMEGIGIAGFVIARYLGGVLTVYLYVINPTAYIETEKE